MNRIFLILPLACLAFASVLLPLDEDSPECTARADSMRTESARLEEAGKYDRAAELDSLSALLYRACGKPEEEGRAFERTGFCFWRMGELDLSLMYYRRARDLYAEHGRPADRASIMNRIGLVYWKRDVPDSALSMFEEVVQIGREAGDSALVARGLGNAGMVYRHIGRYGEALECYRRCLSLHRMAGDREKEALALGNMGVLFSSRGQYREALLCLHEALELSRQAKDVRTEGRVLGNMGIVYWNLGLLDDARDLYEEQLRTARHLQNRLDEATCLDNLGNLKWALADFEAALALYHEAMAIYQELGNRRSEGTIAYDIAQVFLSMDRPEEAREWLGKALEIHRSVRDRWSEALDLTGMGDVALATGDSSEALDAFEKALDLVGEDGAMEIAWYGKFGKGRALEALGKREEAGRLYRESLEVIEQMRSKVNLESLSTRFLESKMEPYVALTRLLVEQGLLEEAFRVCQSAHARTLLDVMSMAGAGIEAGVPEELIKRKTECEVKINELDRKLVSSYAKPGTESLRQEDLTSIEKALLEARKKYEEICREIDLKRVPAAGVPAVVEPPGAKEVQGLLSGSRERAALLEYLSGRRESHHLPRDG